MFEQATLTDGPAGKRAWTTFLGLTSQVALVSFAVLVPMMWPQVLPTARFLEPRQLGEAKQRPTKALVVREGFHSTGFYVQPRIPKGPILLIDDAPTGPFVVGPPDTIGGGSGGGVIGALILDASNNVRVPQPRIPEPVVKPAAVAPTLTVPRYTVGGNVHLGTLLHRAEPQYPPLAKSAHVSGDVELECVVGVDGHIHQVKVTSGNPLLVHAAVDAAWQWVYGPSKLNGVPIEIVTILKFSFKLN
jgi:periplasmic protein TonB